MQNIDLFNSVLSVTAAAVVGLSSEAFLYSNLGLVLPLHAWLLCD